MAVAHRATINRELCVGSAECVGMLPTTFALDNTGIAMVLEGVSDADGKLLIRAAADCPSGAIQVTHDDQPPGGST